MSVTLPADRRLRILFVAQAVSIHTARWISQLRGQGWDLHLFDMLGGLPHAELGGVTEYSLMFPRKIPPGTGKPSYGPAVFLRNGWDPFPLSIAGFFARRIFRNRNRRLASLIRFLRPDVIHSFELQTESYHLLEVAELLGGSIPAPWIVTTWGSDIFYFQNFPAHLDKIKALLQRCDYLIPDCRRDEALAREYGFKGVVPLVLPGSGGYPLAQMREHMAPGPVSSRRLIMLKGYQGWAGRALVALEALERIADALSGYEILLYAASPVILPKVEEIRARRGLSIRVLPRSPHDEILKHFGRARLAIGVNLTDGVPNAMLEAMTLGAFPIQSDTESTAEWIIHGQNGLLVDPEDPEGIAQAIHRGLLDDDLVEAAAVTNARLLSERIDLADVRPKVIDMYRRIATGGVACTA